jgi:osmotically-inducible protein OsmY
MLSVPKRSSGTLARMRKSVFTLLALAACALSSGCVTAVAGAAAGVGLFAMQDRTIGEGIDDASASQQVKARLMAADGAGFSEVDVEVANRSLLLSGIAPTEEHRQAAEMIARNIGSVDNVYNEIFVGPHTGFVRNAADELITAQIRTRLTASPSVRAINVNIETFQGNVYLMGTARSEQELQRAAEIASVVPGVRRVVSFMQLRAQRGTTYAALPPTPEFRGDAGAPMGAPSPAN